MKSITIVLGALALMGMTFFTPARAEDPVSTLNGLIKVAKDGESGYSTAADGVKNADLRALFQAYCAQRAQFAEELQEKVREMGGKPADSATLGSAVFKGWVSVKTAVAKNDDKAVISAVEAGENAAEEYYQDALGESLPEDARSLIRRQSEEISDAHELIRDLAHSTGQGQDAQSALRSAKEKGLKVKVDLKND